MRILTIFLLLTTSAQAEIFIHFGDPGKPNQVQDRRWFRAGAREAAETINRYLNGPNRHITVFNATLSGTPSNTCATDFRDVYFGPNIPYDAPPEHQLDKSRRHALHETMHILTASIQHDGSQNFYAGISQPGANLGMGDAALLLSLGFTWKSKLRPWNDPWSPWSSRFNNPPLILDNDTSIQSGRWAFIDPTDNDLDPDGHPLEVYAVWAETLAVKIVPSGLVAFSATNKITTAAVPPGEYVFWAAIVETGNPLNQQLFSNQWQMVTVTVN